MSEITERENNEPLTAREIEEEEMVEELRGMGMYEKGLTYDDMKDILRAVSESRDMAKKDASNKAMHKAHASYDFASDIMGKPGASKGIDSDVHIGVPKTSYLYKAMHTAPPNFDGSLSPDSNSSEKSASKDSINRHINTNNNEAFEEVQELPSGKDTYASVLNKCMTLRTRNKFPETHSSHISEVKMDVQQDHSPRTDRARFDPFSICANEKDVPLQAPQRPQAYEHMPFKLCKGACTPEKLHEAVTAMSTYLKEVSDLWHSRQRITNNSEFQWGSPIQVGVIKASLDRKLPVDAENEQYAPKNAGDKKSEQGAKRKLFNAIPTFRASDNTDDNDLPSAKKKKLTITAHHETPNSSKMISNSTKISNRPSESPELSDDDFIHSDSERMQNDELQRENSMSPEIKCVYPRRIIPPNPLRTVKIRQVKSKSNRAANTSSTKISKGKLNGNKKEETNIISTKNNEPGNINNSGGEIDMKPSQQKNIEIKPLPMKYLTVRLERQCTALNRNRMSEEKCKLAQLEEEKRKSDEEKKKTEEMMAKSLKEQEEKEKEEQDKQKKQKLKFKQWDERIRLRKAENRVQKQKDQRDKEHLEKEEEERLLADEDIEIINDSAASSVSNVNCPICNKAFSSDEIEYHAAQCVQYSDVDEHIDNNKKHDTRSELVCFVCSFKANDGDEYSVHVSDCLVRQEKAAQGSSEIIVGDVPDSPIRSFRPISALKNATIDYKKQFTMETAMPRTKKRKR